MKRYCKNVDITDPHFIEPFVRDCVFRHYKRHDFKNFLMKFGLSVHDYEYKLLIQHDKNILLSIIWKISKYVADILYREDLSDLIPVSIKTKYDTSCHKEREIGCEGPLQQILDFIAVGSCKEIFDKRIVPQQCASLPKRGQIYGIHMIRDWVRKDNRAISYSKKHNIHYSSQIKYFVKLDIQKCFPSMRIEYFMEYFRKDCANKKILLLWESLLKTHLIDEKHKGFMIGSLISQWAAQYLISFAYRYTMSLHKTGKNKKQTKVSHMIIFMDDMMLTGSNRKELLFAVHMLQRYMKENFGLTIKNTFHIKEFTETTGIDMMGFIVYRTAKISIRGKNYVKIRRAYLKYQRNLFISYFDAKRISSYKGFYIYSNHRKLKSKTNIKLMFSSSSARISKVERGN